MGNTWIDDEKGVELLYGLVGKKVVDIDVESYSYGKVITIKFEYGVKLFLDMVGYPEDWALKIVKYEGVS